MAQDTRNGLETEHNWTMADAVGLDSVTGEADQLMDDLFSDINKILEDGQQLPDNSKAKVPDYVSFESVVVPPIHLPTPPPQSVPDSASSAADTPLSSQPTPPPPTPRRQRLTPDKLLFGFACLTFFGVVGWLFYQGRIDVSPATLLGQRVETQNPQLSESDAEFLEYMARSLRAINRQASVEQPPAEPPTPPAPPAPTATAPAETAQAPTVLERIYIPVYPTESAETPPPPQAPPASPQPEAQASAPAPEIPAPPPQPTARSVPSLPVAPPPPTEPTTPAPEHTLVGLLELGERSAALFNIEGVTQRVRVGEAIGSSGWTLVSIANQKAVIRRNGEVRSIFVGQKL